MNLNLQNLNSAQLQAVQQTDGPLLVLAGAGTGKTRVLTTRICYILSQSLCAPWQILSLTFTNKAANEMKSRLASMSQGEFNSGDIWCGTFHSMCLRILRSNCGRLGLRNDFLIYGEDDQKSVIKTVMDNLGIATTKKPAEYVEEFSRIKDKGYFENTKNSRLFDAYNAELLRLGAIDFGDIILKVIELFEKNSDVLEKYQNQFRYILVDEFQDTNMAQMQLLTCLTKDKENPNICCVGDDDQSIYSWRGAEIKNILNFDKTFPGAKIIRLETNYRSTGNILGVANSLIRNNSGRLGKDLTTCDSKNMGDKVHILTVPSDIDEVKIISDSIIRHGKNYNDIVVLIRSGTLSRPFEEEFARRGIQYRLIGATKFYDRAEIRDVIAYIRLLVHPFDDMSFLRIIGKPRRGFGGAAIDKLRLAGKNLMDGLRMVELSAKQRANANEFLSAFDFDWENMSPKDAVKQLLDAAGYMNMWATSKDSDAQDRISNIKELINNVIVKYDSLHDFLEEASLMMTDDNDSDVVVADNDAVNIMTIHAAKGLEFETVFLPGWEEGIFPNEKSINDGSIEEERRLAYVAITRARQYAIITNTMSRFVYGTRQYNSPSRFISEMDTRFLDFSGGRTTLNHNTNRNFRFNSVKNQSEKLVGKLVSHSDLGSGVVIEENNGILTIAFKNKGIKKVAKEYIEVL
ncbi:MAG: ATP-dependent helicase [Alphaproteobacteria bacterium]